MSAASDRIKELVYPTKPRIYIGLGGPPDERVTATDLRAVVDERAALLAALVRLQGSHMFNVECRADQACFVCAAIAKAEGK